MNSEAVFADLLAPYASGRGLARLIRYAELLERWAPHHNLVRYGSREELVQRHIVDALAAAPVVRGRRSLLDVGSGAGLPGVPLLAVSPGCCGTLLEPRQKRWAFLRLVVRELALEAEVDRRRFESIEDGRQWDVITARAVGRDEALLAWALERLQPGGEVVLWTTEDGETRLAKEAGWRVLSSALPGLERGRLCRLQPCFT